MEMLRKYKDTSKFELYGYCVIDNQVHLLIRDSKEGSISEAVKRIRASYIYWYNLKYERCGHLSRRGQGSCPRVPVL